MIATTQAAPGTDRALEQVVREQAGRLVASLYRTIGDLDVAEEAVAEAVVEALGTWRRTGTPSSPGAWLLTAARHNALDRLRRETRYREKLGRIASDLRELTEDGTETAAAGAQMSVDDRLPLLFGCCHPALSRSAQLALTLRAVAGLTTAEIARATLSSETATAQRIVRAKRKIGLAGIPVRVPDADELPARLDTVLTVIYLTYNEAYLATAGPDPERRDLADDALWLSALVASALPGEPEALGLLALLHLNQARASARFDERGQLVLLADQDRSRYERDRVDRAGRLLERAAAERRPGRFQLQAAIAACHADAATWAETDWLQILVLYDLLLTHDRSPVVRLNRAIAIAHVHGAARALEELDGLQAPLHGYHLLHAARAHLLRELGRTGEARAADALALARTANSAERALLLDRLGEQAADGSS